jgi:pyruvate/2-oxoglutarate dehydrogenase complex dihydrolipoamide dehydrogenase (E3) component
VSAAKEQGIVCRRFKIPLEAVMRASTLSETRGFPKALVETKSERILSFTAFGVGATEIMISVQIAMQGRFRPNFFHLSPRLRCQAGSAQSTAQQRLPRAGLPLDLPEA